MSTTPSSGPSLNLRGAVDLSSLGNAAGASNASASGSPGESGAGGWVVEVTEQTLEQVVTLSMQVPVLVDLWATWCQPCKQLTPILEKVTAEQGGRLLLAKIDIDANQRIAQAFGVQSVPTIIALVKGQPVPLFQGAQPEAQVRQIVEQLLAMAEQNGVNGVLPGGEGESSESGPTLPPLHAAAQEAMAGGDFDGAAAAYDQALAENPGDEEARLGRVRVLFLQRVSSYDPAQVRSDAADQPKDIAVACRVADLDIAGGHVEDGLKRLLDLMPGRPQDEKFELRDRLVELFDVVGPTDDRVMKARRQLASALF